MYSHDSYGLGHIRRSIAIANRRTYTRAITAFKLSGLDSIERRIKYPKRPYAKVAMLPEEEMITESVGLAN
jgi:predicted glycosyltransferase